MPIVVELPPEFESELRAAWPELEHRALEGLVTEAFRSGRLSRYEGGLILGIESRWEAIRFLSERGICPGTEVDELNKDREALARVISPGCTHEGDQRRQGW